MTQKLFSIKSQSLGTVGGGGVTSKKSPIEGKGEALLPGLIGVSRPNHRKNSAKSRKNLNFHFCAVKQRMGSKYFKILSNALS